MRRAAIAASFGLLVVAPCLAQAPEPLPITAVFNKQNLSSELKMKYIIRQLDLKPDQVQHVQGLMESFAPNKASGANIDIEKIRVLAKQMEDAQKAGNQAEVDRIRQLLVEEGRGESNEEDLYTNLANVLTDEQKARLAEIRARLATNPTGSIRPMDVVRAARATKLTDEQSAKLNALRDKFRTTISDGPKLTEEQEKDLLNSFIGDVREVLTPDQLQRFNDILERMRPDTLK